jgi:ubiquinone/menaquinone biosynthesis C-methylase UbiE
MTDEYESFDGCEILEFGSGTGKDWINIINDVSSRCHLIMSDFSSGMVESLKERYGHLGNIDVMQIDIQDIPFDKESKDFVIAHSMLYHVPDIDKAVSEVHRILKPKGKFYSATMGSKGMFTFFKDTLHEVIPQVSMAENIRFTLQNGKPYLQKHFSNVDIVYNNGRLEVTDANDIIDFAISTASIDGIKESDRPKLIEYYEAKKNDEGKIIIELEYGMFVAVK